MPRIAERTLSDPPAGGGVVEGHLTAASHGMMHCIGEELKVIVMWKKKYSIKSISGKIKSFNHRPAGWDGIGRKEMNLFGGEGVFACCRVNYYHFGSSRSMEIFRGWLGSELSARGLTLIVGISETMRQRLLGMKLRWMGRGCRRRVVSGLLSRQAQIGADAQQIPRKAGRAAVVTGQLQSQNGSSVELDQILTLQQAANQKTLENDVDQSDRYLKSLDEIRRNQTPPTIQQFAVVKSVLVHSAPHQDVVAACQGDFRFRIVVG